MSGQDEHLDKEKVRTALRKIAGDISSGQSFAWAAVKSVDKAVKTAICVDSSSDLAYYDVLLGLGSVIAVPVVGTTVLLGLISSSGEASFIVWASEVEEHFIVTKKGFKLWLKDDGTAMINGDGLDGLAVVGKIAEKLNNIEKAFNDHMKEFNTHIHSGGTISGSTAVVASPTTLNLEKTSKYDLENKKIKHGD